MTVAADVLNLNLWKVNLPTLVQVTQPALATFNDPAHFTVNGDRTTAVLTAECGGQAQPGSSYPRSELREMVDATGSAGAAWSTTTGTHTMLITQAVTHLPVARPHVICGQIHDDNYLVAVHLNGSRLYVDVLGSSIDLNTSYRLGSVFTIKLVAHNGTLDVYYNGLPAASVSIGAHTGCYFKAGCYTQSSTATGDLATAYGQVEIGALTVRHA